MAYENLIAEREDSIGIISLNRPPANPINVALLNELEAVLKEWEKDKTVKVVIITGAGEKAFCAGFDVKTVGTPEGTDAMPRGHQVFGRIEKYPKPVIAAINGFALGGGCELALSCHFRIMVNSAGAVIGLPEINLGIMPGWGGTQRLPRLVGKAKALEMLLLGLRLTAPEALSIGLITRMSEPGRLMDDAKEMARQLARKAPLSVRAILDSVTRGMETTTEEGLKIELENVQGLWKTKDAKEGVSAFLEKREPVFRGE